MVKPMQIEVDLSSVPPKRATYLGKRFEESGVYCL